MYVDAKATLSYAFNDLVKKPYFAEKFLEQERNCGKYTFLLNGFSIGYATFLIATNPDNIVIVDAHLMDGFPVYPIFSARQRDTLKCLGGNLNNLRYSNSLHM